MNKLKIIIFGLMFSTLVVACKKDKKEDPTPQQNPASFTMKVNSLSFMADSSPRGTYFLNPNAISISSYSIDGTVGFFLTLNDLGTGTFSMYNGPAGAI